MRVWRIVCQMAKESFGFIGLAAFWGSTPAPGLTGDNPFSFLFRRDVFLFIFHLFVLFIRWPNASVEGTFSKQCYNCKTAARQCCQWS